MVGMIRQSRVPVAAAVAALITLLLLGSCGTPRSGLDPSDTAAGSKQPPAAGQTPGADVPGAGALPGLADLPQGGKQLSLVGPGWLPLEHGSILLDNGLTQLPGNAVNVDGGTGFAYGLYGIYGFDGDNGPTSARVTAANVVGEYFVGFSGYQSGRWLWAGPFTDSAEVEIPNSGDFMSPTAFVSPYKVTYLVLAAAAGNSADLTPELGVHGGARAPAPPANFNVGIGNNRLMLQWLPSSGSLLPDFGGYRIERAPGLFGSFTPLLETQEVGYLDEDVVNGQTYRYRVAAFDVSENTSIYTTSGPVSPQAAALLDPVVVVSMPTGPFQAPAEITIDLSGSFDPEGGIIDTYIVEGLTYFHSGPSPVFTVTLQPGCHVLSLKASVGVRTGTQNRVVKAYPNWAADPVTVAESTGNLPRLQRVRTGQLPDGRTLMLGFDPAIQALGLWTQTPTGFSFRPVSTRGESISFIGEPLADGDSLLFPITFADDIVVLRCNADETEVIQGATRHFPSQAACALVSGPDGPGLIFSSGNGGNPDLQYRKLDGASSPEVVVVNHPLPLHDLDAVYTPGAGAIDIAAAYPGGFGLLWDRFQPGVGVVASDQLTLESTHHVDLEVNPVTGRPVLMHFYVVPSPPGIRYQALEPGLTWSPVEQVMDANIQPGADMVVNSAGTFVFAGHTDGFTNTYNLYERDPDLGTWSARNTLPFELAPGEPLALVVDPPSGHARVVGRGMFSTYYSMLLRVNGSVEETWSLRGGRGLGRELHGATGADGLHIIYRETLPAASRHFGSSFGDIWVDHGNPFPVAANNYSLASQGQDEVYASFVNGATAELQYWDGVTWNPELSLPTTADHHPGLGGIQLGSDIMWTVYDPGANQLRFVEGSQGNPYMTQIVAPSFSPVWDMIIAPAFNPRAWGLAGGADPQNGQFGYFDWSTSQFHALAGAWPLEPTEATWGRTMTTAIGYDFGDPLVPAALPNTTIWLAHGFLIDPVRITQSVYGALDIEHFPQNTYMDFFQGQEYRRTVSSMNAQGITPVGLIADLHGYKPRLEWSCVGLWEQLPLPAGYTGDEGTYASKPIILNGTDGRWHIVYHDLTTDEIRVRSTL